VGRPPKRRVSPFTDKNTSSTPKRVKKSEFMHPNNSHEIHSSADEREVEAVPEVIKDISDIEFTVTRCCILGSDPILEDTDFVKLGEFSYRQFETLAIRKLDKAALDAKVDFEWESGQAVISAKTIAMRDHLKFAVEDDSGWKKVEKGVERWMRENKKEIKVKLTAVYKKKRGNTAVCSEDEGGDSKMVLRSQKLLIFDTQKPYK
jgi:hypothetical protein